MKLSTWILMVDFITIPIFTELQYISLDDVNMLKLVWKLSNLYLHIECESSMFMFVCACANVGKIVLIFYVIVFNTEVEAYIHTY